MRLYLSFSVAPVLRLGASILFALALTTAAAESTGDRVSYNRDIRPILAENCFTCHGQDDKSRKGGLRIDTREGSLQGGKSDHAAITPGKPDESELIARILTSDADDHMPPADTGKDLKPEQIALLKRWIEQGAEYQAHWAFIAPERPAVKSPGDLHPIDQFVRARLKREKLKPSREASPETLIRRVALDLTGLPPTPSEVTSFVAAHRLDPEGAYSRLVDELIASPHFGEKWARHWMDVARYADSDGYEKDLPRDQWPWRDWVIQAINRDMPYDQFVIEQLAGDLLPNATQDQQIATGFLRNGMINEEGAIIAEQFRMEGMFDRMDCVGKAVLGLTLQCAQCHTHKYDPLTHDEYYQLFAFMNDTYDATSWIYKAEELDRVTTIRKKTNELEDQLKAARPMWREELREWEEKAIQGEQVWQPLVSSAHEWIGGLAHPERLPDNSILTLGFRPTVGELVFTTTNLPSTNLAALRLEALTHGDLPFNGPGRSHRGSFAVSELIVEARPLGSTNGWTNLALTNAIADFAQADQPIEQFLRKDDKDNRRVGPASYLIDGKEETAWGPDRGPGLRNQDSTWAAQFVETNKWPEGPLEFRVMFKYRHGGPEIHGRQNNFLGRFRLAASTNTEPLAPLLPASVARALAIPPAERTTKQAALVFAHWRSSAPDLKEWNEKIAALWKDHPEGGSVLNLAKREPEFTRETFLQDRGAWDKPKHKVTPGVPAFLHPLAPNAPADRLAFARWLVDPKSPTTARVYVNRTWHILFGIGLVESVEDLGTRAELPTHPELLDWLAVEFMEPSFDRAAHGSDDKLAATWSVKRLLRTMVTSATYKQSSRFTPELLERDPNNLLLARGPRFRVESEVVRDIALTAAGILERKQGGPSFYPPVPESMFALNYAKIEWKPAPAPERYRRSLYMFRRRSMPDPVMASFDAPNGDFSCARRVRSNAPLAALTSLNEQVFVEAAQALALRVLREADPADPARATLAFQLCTGRAPQAAEKKEILTLLRERKVRISQGWVGAREIAFADASKLPELPSGVTPTDVAAWTVVARVLLNLDETVTKN